ncbi:8142_t:CDS:2, partial [Dentiscutata erythropus]
ETHAFQEKEEDEQKTLLQRIYQLIGKLQEDRIQAQKNIKRSQDELKERRKLIDPWKGPYYIHEVLSNG